MLLKKKKKKEIIKRTFELGLLKSNQNSFLSEFLLDIESRRIYSSISNNKISYNVVHISRKEILFP